MDSQEESQEDTMAFFEDATALIKAAELPPREKEELLDAAALIDAIEDGFED
jgi:hypothetical protein